MNLLFLCTGNSARSILAEALANQLGKGRHAAYSAGSGPAGRVHPQALALLAARGHDTRHLRSKSWEEFTGDGAPAMDLVITVCDVTAAQTCPVWPGAPRTEHWSLPDPAAAAPDALEAAFEATYADLESRIRQLLTRL